MICATCDQHSLICCSEDPTMCRYLGNCTIDGCYNNLKWVNRLTICECQHHKDDHVLKYVDDKDDPQPTYCDHCQCKKFKLPE